MTNLDAGPAVRFGFLGAGYIAHRALGPAVHAADGAVLHTAAARDADRARALEPSGPVHTDYAAILADDDVEVVYLSLSNESHRPWVVASLEAGKHVLCEKPLGLDAAEVAEMAAAARAADRLLVEAFWYRWHPRTRRLEQLLAEGALGPVRRLDAEFSYHGDGEALAGNYRLDPARGGGALYDVGCYAVSAAHLVLGPRLEVDRVETTMGPTGVDLATTAWLRVPDDDTSDAAATARVRGGISVPDRQAVVVTGDAATLAFATGQAFAVWHQPASLTITTPDGAVRTEEFAPVDPYRLMVEAVARRVRGEDAFLVGLDHSAQVGATLDAIRAPSAA